MTSLLLCRVLQGLGGEPGPVPVHRRGLCLPVCPTHPDFDSRSAGTLSVVVDGVSLDEDPPSVFDSKLFYV